MTSPRTSPAATFTDGDRNAFLRVGDPLLRSGEWGAVERVVDRTGERFIVHAPGNGLGILFEVRVARKGRYEVVDEAGRILSAAESLLSALKPLLPAEKAALIQVA